MQFSETAAEVRLPAYAKINLDLRIVGKRPDGYHDIQTLFQQISLQDNLQIKAFPSKENQIFLKVDKPNIPDNEDNLVWKAARAFLTSISQTFTIEIFLEKSVPAGAGLGGGSSDAAATLIGLNLLTKANVSVEELKKMSVKLGADIPFFLTGGAAYAEGVGDRLEQIDSAIEFWAVVVVPPVHISTKWAYSNIRIPLTSGEDGINFTRFFQAQDRLQEWRNVFRNDFQELVFKHFPELAEIKRALYAQGAIYANLSGTGSALFGLFNTQSQARTVGEMFEKNNFVSVVEPTAWGMRDVFEKIKK